MPFKKFKFKPQHAYLALEFIFLLPPGVTAALTNLLVYNNLLYALPFGFFGFSVLSTFGVWDLTLPALAREPWTLP